MVGINGEIIELAYDAFNRLRSATSGSAVTDYRLNALGQRLYKRTTNGAAVSHSLSAYDPSGAQILEYKESDGWNQFIRLGGEPIAVIRNGVPYYLHGDHLGRPEVVTSPSKAIVWRASNLAFDRSVTQDAFGGLSLGFPGQFSDAETGLWHNGFRDYDPVTGRYIQSDPVAATPSARDSRTISTTFTSLNFDFFILPPLGLA